MSDLVRYAVGNTANRDHPQWPTILESEVQTVIGPMTQDQIKELWPGYATLDQIMALCWRVKKWRITGFASATVARSDQPGVLATGISNITTPIDLYALRESGIAATREADLVSRQFNSTYRALVGGGISTITGADLSMSWSATRTDLGTQTGTANGSTPIGLSLLNGFVLFDPATGLFSPPIIGIGRVLPLVFFEYLSITAVVFRNPVSVGSHVGPGFIKGPGTLTIVSGIAPPFVVPMQVSSRANQEPPGVTITGSATCAFTLTAIEFWPYKNSADEPVYDTDTGAQLVDPFS